MVLSYIHSKIHEYLCVYKACSRGPNRANADAALMAPDIFWIDGANTKLFWIHCSGLILGLHTANEGRRYKVAPTLIGWVQT